jgi:hypothetical protein
MKKKAVQRASKPGHRAIVILAVAAVVVATAVTVISRQNLAAKSATNVAPVVTRAVTTAATSTANHAYVTRRVGNQDIQIDTQTGQVKPLTPQEAQELAEGLAPMVDQSTDGLVQVRHADGSVSMDLQGRFQSVAVARITTEGTIEQGCVDNPRAAAAFFGISPKLIEDAQAAQRRLKPNQTPN